MDNTHFVKSDHIRHKFSQAMSAMYQQEVPLYKDLMDLVATVNAQTLDNNPTLKQQLASTGELSRIDLERHGAIRLGLPSELATMRQVLAVMGMYPVGYYDLAGAGVPVHSTAFRAKDADALSQSPFRIFCSLLRLELIKDDALRAKAQEVLEQRQIFSDTLLNLVKKYEQQGGLNQSDADSFVKEATKVFQWHKTSPIDKALYDKLSDEHRLIADIVGFQGPHINHLTPRTLDIDKAQAMMIEQGIPAKEIIEGPPKRNCPILLRQTSFKALKEPIVFAEGAGESGSHTARFGEIEQRGIALTKKGRQLYDELLTKVRTQAGTPEKDPAGYYQVLSDTFADFPDDYNALYEQDLAYFFYRVNKDDERLKTATQDDAKALVADGVLAIEPIVYEDFLPVSAAGIFQSNLGDDAKEDNTADLSDKQAFEAALGATVYDECALYQAMMDKSLAACLAG